MDRVIFLDLFFGYGLQSGIGDLLWQVITGNSPNLNKTMWYQADLIIITLIFAVAAEFLSPKNRDRCLFLLLPMVLVMQYSGLNEKLFIHCRYEIMYPAGRLMEMIPYAVLGYFVAKSGIVEKVVHYRFETIVGAAVIILWAKYFETFQTPPGFFYQGISHVFISFAIFLFFFALPLNVLPFCINIIISYLTKYTLGIYCMHRMVATVVNKLVFGRVEVTNSNSFFECVLLYCICYAIAFVIDKFSCKVLSQAVN